MFVVLNDVDKLLCSLAEAWGSHQPYLDEGWDFDNVIRDPRNTLRGMSVVAHAARFPKTVAEAMLIDYVLGIPCGLGNEVCVQFL